MNKYYKLAKLIRHACKNISEDDINKDIYIGGILGYKASDAHPEQLIVTDDSGYRSILIGDTRGNVSIDNGNYDKTIKNKGYVLIYSENADEEGHFKYKCFPPAKIIADRLKAIANKETFYAIDDPNYSDDVCAYSYNGVIRYNKLSQRHNKAAVEYFAETVKAFADMIDADSRNVDDIFNTAMNIPQI